MRLSARGRGGGDTRLIERVHRERRTGFPLMPLESSETTKVGTFCEQGDNPFDPKKTHEKRERERETTRRPHKWPCYAQQPCNDCSVVP